MPERIATGVKDIVFHVHPEGQEYVDDNGRAHGQAGDVDEIFPDGGCGDPEDLSDAGTDAEDLPFDKIFQTGHVANIFVLNI
jgi:hypothetical protein